MSNTDFLGRAIEQVKKAIEQDTNGDYEKAYDIYRQFLEFSPNEDQVPLARYEYMIRRSKTDQNDPNARAQLARFAEERGLIETARQEYLNVLLIAPKNSTANEAMRRFAAVDLQDAELLLHDILTHEIEARLCFVQGEAVHIPHASIQEGTQSTMPYLLPKAAPSGCRPTKKAKKRATAVFRASLSRPTSSVK